MLAGLGDFGCSRLTRTGRERRRGWRGGGRKEGRKGQNERIYLSPKSHKLALIMSPTCRYSKSGTIATTKQPNRTPPSYSGMDVGDRTDRD